MAYYGSQTLQVKDGGTGERSLTSSGVLVGNGTGAITVLTAGTSDQLIVGASSADPAFGTTSAITSYSFSASSAGADVQVTVENTSNTASSQAIVVVTSGGSSGGDPENFWNVASNNAFATGADNSVTNDPFILCSGSSLGTTNRMVINTGAVTFPATVAFLTFLATDVTNVTGQSATYTLGSGTALTEVFDQASSITTGGTLTAPVTGRYDLRVNFTVIGTTVATSFNAALVTSNRTYVSTFTRAASNANQSWNISAICDMDAADTCTFQMAVTGEVADTDDIDGASGTLVTFASGALVA